MSVTTADMDLDERDERVLDVLADGRANPFLLRKETGLSKGAVNTVLNRLARAGLVEQVVRGLYEITEDGKRRAGADDE
jgi:Sugar-specific transcriptional regulator TrmB.